MPDARRALPSLASDLTKLAEISPSDIEAAVDAWNRSCRATFRGLLEAEPITGEERIDRPILG